MRKQLLVLPVEGGEGKVWKRGCLKAERMQ